MTTVEVDKSFEEKSSPSGSWIQDIRRMSIADLKNPVFWRDCFCEFIAANLLVLFVTLSLVSNDHVTYPVTTTHIGLFIALVIFLLTEGFGPISAYLNLAMTIALFLTRQCSLARVIIYTGIQVLAACTGSSIGYALMANKGLSDGSITFRAFNPEVNGLTNIQGIFVEGILVFNFIFVALVLLGGPKATFQTSPPAFAIAFCNALGPLIAGTFTGGVMNPMVAFGAGFLANDYTSQWVYWVGPVSGSLVAVLTYKIFVYVGVNYDSSKSKSKMANITDAPALSRDELVSLVENFLQNSKISDSNAARM